MRTHMGLRGVLALAGMGVALSAGAVNMQVQVRDGQLRSTPSFLGRPLASVAYGTSLQIVEQKSPWVKASTGQAEGWIHESALTNKRIQMTAGGADVNAGASSDEIALAGKGFSSEVEQAYRKQNPTLDFSTIDRMEKIKVTPEQARRFLQEGGLQP